MAGLATVLVIGNRKGFGKERFEPHNILVTFMGMSMLWVGWYGFYAGTLHNMIFLIGFIFNSINNCYYYHHSIIIIIVIIIIILLSLLLLSLLTCFLTFNLHSQYT